MPTPLVKLIWVLSVLLVSLAVEAEALIRVGGGLVVIEGEFAPLGRVVLDVIPLWFIAVSLDAEYWLLSADHQRLLPFVTLSSPLIFRITVGAAPIVTISPLGIGILPNTLAFKGGVGVPFGPLQLFLEGVFIAAPEVAERPFLAAGVMLGF